MYSTRVIEDPEVGRVIAFPRVCDDCGRVQKLVVEETSTCCEGDEVDGCSLLAVRQRCDENWWQFSHTTEFGMVDRDFCPECGPEHLPPP